MEKSAAARLHSRRGTWVSWALLAATLGAGAPAAMLAADDTANSRQRISARISLADLDLNSAAGARIAQERILAQARRLCAKFRDTRSVAQWETYVECVTDTVADAQARIGYPLLAQGKEPVSR